jgi:N-acetylglucosaminyldiphosphoundecaprenol N-acetyl-beta-D-mannosaminyltransferase
MTYKDRLSILGIPIDNVTLNEAVDRIFSMINGFKNDCIPRYVATVNVDFIVNTLSWSIEHSRHPELLDILRRADLVTADGMPVVWISKIMDSPLKERVTGSDMLPYLSGKAAELGKSIFLFGARPGIADNAAKILIKKYPGLKIAGTYSPDIATEGEAMLDSFEKDKEIVTMINNSGTDILFIGLGNPKQEIWFNRNRDSIKVPVSIGVGGSFSFITGDVSRAPEWMQKSGLEWIYRICQDPCRLWKRYFNGLVKLGTSTILPVIYHKICRALLMIRSHKSYATDKIGINVRHNKNSVILKMPVNATRESISDIWAFILHFKESSLVIDFKETRYIDLYVMGFLLNLWRYYISIRKNIYLSGMSPLVKRALKYNRLWDIALELIQEDCKRLTEQVINKSKEPSFSFTTSSNEKTFRIELHGRLDAASISRLDIKGLIESIGNKNCIINLKELKFIDSTGLTFFIKIKKHLSSHNKTPFMCNANEDIMQIFNITKLKNLFKILPDFDNTKFLSGDSI